MEKNISTEEANLATLQKQLVEVAPSDYNKLTELTEKIAVAEAKLEQLFSRWNELSQKTT